MQKPVKLDPSMFADADFVKLVTFLVTAGAMILSSLIFLEFMKDSRPDTMSYIMMGVVGFFSAAIISAVGIIPIVERVHPKCIKVRKYNEALAAYEKYLLMQQRGEWLGLGGRDFEFAVGDLMEALGYKVQVGSGSNDRGIDISMEKDGVKIIVQCKNHKRPVGPAVARELWGAFKCTHAHEAWLVASSGWTKGVAEFAHFKKNFKLLNVDDLIKLNEQK